MLTYTCRHFADICKMPCRILDKNPFNVIFSREIKMYKGVQSLELSEVLGENIHRINKEKEILFKKYFSENVEDSIEFEYLVNRYIETIKNHMKKSNNKTIEKNKFPFIILWSIVEVQDMDDMETYKFLVIPPYSKHNDVDTDADIDYVSMMSPLGRALLLKKAEQDIIVNVPQGTLNYKIKRIIIP
jgi:transcription elongation factor GreA